MKLPVLFASAAASVVAFAAPAHAVVILSENFNSGFGAFTVESTTIARNTARPGYQICCGVVGSDAALDNPFVVFGAGNVTNRGSIFAEFQTVAGRRYELSFDAGAFGGGTTNLTYTFGGTATTLTLAADNNADTTFGRYTASFVGTGSPSSIAFSSRGPGTNIDPVLDNVSISAVPEPATWGMMILGFGAVGGALRRRAKASATVRYA